MQRQWEANRWFLTADGEADKAWGNETVRAHPEAGWLELKLPPRWATLRTGPTAATGSCPATFHHRGDHWAAQAASGPVRYDISYHPERSRWHLDASWKTHHQTVTLAELCRRRALGVDLNADHLAAWVVDPDGNPIGRPHTIPLDLDGLPASTRDGRLREAISRLVDLATTHRCASVSIENLGFTEARQAGRETMGRGGRGRRFRRTVAALPTARFRHRLVGMAHNRGVAIVAVDPAYTTRWGAQHWRQPLRW